MKRTTAKDAKDKEWVNCSRLWRCDECGNGGELEAWDYETMAAKGGPICPSCGFDMVLTSDRL